MEKPSVEFYLNHIQAATPAIGAGWRKMRCPFHEDAHASAAVNYDKNVFKCHGCGVAGDTYSLIQLHEGMSFSEAIQFAQTVLAQGYATVREPHTSSGRGPRGSQSVGRRGTAVSSGSGRRSTARS